MGISGLLFNLFSSFKTKITILKTNICEIFLCPSSIRCTDWNQWPLEDEFPPITTRPGLPPQKTTLFELKLLPLKKCWWRQNFGRRRKKLEIEVSEIKRQTHCAHFKLKVLLHFLSGLLVTQLPWIQSIVSSNPASVRFILLKLTATSHW